MGAAAVAGVAPQLVVAGVPLGEAEAVAARTRPDGRPASPAARTAPMWPPSSSLPQRASDGTSPASPMAPEAIVVSERRGSSPLRSLRSTGWPSPFGYQYECACGRAGRSPGWNARPSPPGALSTSRRASAAIGAPPARSRISPASTNPASEYSASSVRGPGFPAAATNCRRVGVTRGWSNTRKKNASGGPFIPDVWPSRSRTVASGSPATPATSAGSGRRGEGGPARRAASRSTP